MSGFIADHYGRDGRRLGTLRACGAARHREELGGEDVLELACLEAPEKYERLVWRDPEDGRWREHVVVRTDERAGGGCGVYCEGSLCDLLAGVVEELRLTGATAAEAASAVLAPAGWESSATGLSSTAACMIYHANRLSALRRVCEVWGAEPDPYVEVGASGVTARGVVLRARVGAWRGARLTYGRNMAGCVRTVAEDEVYTALYGWGAGEAVMGEDGTWTGGYRKRIGFASVNGGAGWVGDEAARLAWGISRPDGTRAHRFGQVVFSGVTDPERVLELTQAELPRACRPRISYAVEAAVLEGRVPVLLGDTVAVTDTAPPAPRVSELRVVAREREIGDGVVARYTLGSVLPTVHAAASDVAHAVRDVEDAAGAAGDAAAAVSAVAAEVRAATGAASGGAVPALATKAYVDGLFAELDDLSEVEF
ncbi:phage tail protein [Collinsella sp. An271]|uniref:phage tail protein n=1 Tax=Collinsella sp. An271 TaxID=1965616 RepID=UPI001EF70D4B|nr:phage tail protein [Collinsella sp. An271]